MEFRNRTHADLIGLFHSLCLAQMEQVLRTPEIQTFVQRDDSHFDLVIIEGTFCGECLLAMGHKYKAPVINFQPLGYWPSNYYVYGNLLSPAVIPDFRLRKFHQTYLTDRRQSVDTPLTIKNCTGFKESVSTQT